jgi:hypothetical protein
MLSGATFSGLSLAEEAVHRALTTVGKPVVYRVMIPGNQQDLHKFNP